MAEGQSITFFSSGPLVVFGVVTVAVTAVLCFLAWRRSDYARGTGGLEALRLLLVVLVALTLNQPEWLSAYKPTHKPTLVVLWDQSRSMETQDVVDADSPAAEPRTRAESIQPLLAEEVWKPVDNRMNVAFEPFSSDLNPAAEGTDLSGGLRQALEAHPHLRGVVLLSDGDWNVGESPARAAMQLRMKNVPVYAVGVGSKTPLPDVELTSLDAPTFGVAQKTMRIPFVVRSSLPYAYDTTVLLSSTTGQT
ncbi:MAG: vWA domain-containing protein, partial [Phycisphaeraceae bacterium]|nr:vWA domain-containing protein [Phycisphaeraceae bacterium]